MYRTVFLTSVDIERHLWSWHTFGDFDGSRSALILCVAEFRNCPMVASFEFPNHGETYFLFCTNLPCLSNQFCSQWSLLCFQINSFVYILYLSWSFLVHVTCHCLIKSLDLFLKDLQSVDMYLEALKEDISTYLTWMTLTRDITKIKTDLPKDPIAPNVIVFTSPGFNVSSTGTTLWCPARELRSDMFVGTFSSLMRIWASPAEIEASWTSADNSQLQGMNCRGGVYLWGC